MSEHIFTFEQIHIEVARNASDDFNLFHDKHKWLQITKNPFKGPIVLGYQLNALIEYQMRLYRESHHEDLIISENNLRYSNYKTTFINALRPNFSCQLEIKKTLVQTIPDLILSNRISIKSEEKTILLGFKKETKHPLFLKDIEFDDLPNLHQLTDKTRIPNTDFFLKRKRLDNGNAKNFLSGSLVEQADYFDELTHVAHYPEIFPCSLVSGALLEKAQLENHDFKRNPMVYTSHEMSIDRLHLKKLKNDDPLYILVKQHPESKINTLNKTKIMLRTYDCFGLLQDKSILFRVQMSLVPLNEILKNLRKK